jgi:hypothetical protein
MANIPIYNGSSTFVPNTGLTPFGFYDNDVDFQTDADKVVKFCAQRLGWPIENVELQDTQFYTAFEQAVTVYGNELFAYKQREDYLSVEGSNVNYTTNNNFATASITPNLSRVIKMSEQYGAEAGVGGELTWYSGSIVLTSSIQDYDLGQWAIDNDITGSDNNPDLEITRVFYNDMPAINRFYDPYGATGTGMAGMMDAFGWGAYSPAISFLLMPLSFDTQRLQQIEMNDQIRKSNFTFQLIDNKLRVFPIPGDSNDGNQYWFQYIRPTERVANSIAAGSNNVNDISQMPYKNPIYSHINSVGRSWIFEYALALCKEMLGFVRNKYSQVPIPGAEIQLNGDSLISSAQNEKDALIAKLRDYFDQTSRQSLLERRAAESTARNSELSNVPMVIFVG